MKFTSKLHFVSTAFLLVLFVACNTKEEKPSVDDGGLILPAGFSSTIVADSLGKARHIVVTPQNDIYVRLQDPVKGVSTLLLHEDTGKAKLVYGFDSVGGTGVRLYDGYLYTATTSEVFRYKLDDKNRIIDTAVRERIVTGLIARHQHEQKSIEFDDKGDMFIPVGCPSNACQEQDRQKGSMGMSPCPLLDSAGGVWMFSREKKDQTYADGVRYATGLRNVVGLAWNYEDNKLFVMQHGRDQLSGLFPQYYNDKQSAQLPAECMYAVSQGDNAGWPYIYYDPFKKKKMLAPEYGGDGVKTLDSNFIDPMAAYPAHLAPNDILFYTGDMFPERYKNGAFIAFHGSWNRSPEPQAGFFIVFQPFKDGKPDGDWEVFADGFTGGPDSTAKGHALHRPCGLAQGPDGSLYVSDDSKGTIYKITYNHKDLERDKNKPAPFNFRDTLASKTDTAMVSADAGKNIYTANCVTCHQPDGKGSGVMTPPLSGAADVVGDKSKIISIVLHGISNKEIDGKKYSNVMPAFQQLSDDDIAKVLTYIRSNFGNNASAVTSDEVKKLRAKK